MRLPIEPLVGLMRHPTVNLDCNRKGMATLLSFHISSILGSSLILGGVPEDVLRYIYRLKA